MESRPPTQEAASSSPGADLAEHLGVSARLAELLGDGSERQVALVDRLVSGFPARAAGLVDLWWSAVRRGEHQEAERALHTLRGAALNLGARRVSLVCEDLESRSRSGRADAGRADRERLESALAALALLLAAAVPAHGHTG